MCELYLFTNPSPPDLIPEFTYRGCVVIGLFGQKLNTFIVTWWSSHTALVCSSVIFNRSIDKNPKLQVKVWVGLDRLTCSLKSSRRTFMHSSTTSLSSMSRTAGTASPVITDMRTACFPYKYMHTKTTFKSPFDVAVNKSETLETCSKELQVSSGVLYGVYYWSLSYFLNSVNVEVKSTIFTSEA